MIIWSAVRAAIHEWATLCSGLPPTQIIWGRQSGPRPSKPFIMMDLTALRTSGRDWTDVEDNPTPVAGEEILHVVRGPRWATLRIQAFSDSITTDDTAAILDRLQSYASLPSVQDVLSTGGVAVLRVGDIESTSGIINTVTLEPRSILTVTLSLASEVQETGSFFETVDFEITVAD